MSSAASARVLLKGEVDGSSGDIPASVVPRANVAFKYTFGAQGRSTLSFTASKAAETQRSGKSLLQR